MFSSCYFNKCCRPQKHNLFLLDQLLSHSLLEISYIKVYAIKVCRSNINSVPIDCGVDKLIIALNSCC